VDVSTDSLRQHLIDPEFCARCNSCEEACRRNAILHDASNYAVDPALCAQCGDCMSACSTGAIDNWRVVPGTAAYSVEQQLAWQRLPDALSADPSLAGAALDAAPEATAFLKPRRPASAAPAAVNRYGRESPARLTIYRNERLTLPADGAEVRHIVLECDADSFPVREGQSVGIVPPGLDAAGRPHHVRLYSVASAHDGEIAGSPTFALTVKRVLQDHQGVPVRGVCSNFLCDLPAGAPVRVSGPVGETFLMPEEPGAPLLMICTGTGIAPMRAMLQRRLRLSDARREDLMLFYGGRTPQELPYLQELAAISPALLDCNIAYSRLAGHPKRYVQDLLIERASDVARMIVERCATIFLCGLKSMEHGVRDALTEALATTAGGWPALEGELIAAGRYHVEVY